MSLTDGDLQTLEKQRELMKTYVQLKIDVGDLHGAIDGLMDMREIDAQIVLLKRLESNE